MPKISNLEIFGAGRHKAATGELTVTETDLDKIVDAFHSLQGSNIVRPHLKLGHTDAQKWFGQTKGVPSLGWITRLWRQGTKLLADISDVPEALIDLIKSGRYHNVSAELLWGDDDKGNGVVEHMGRHFSRVLTAVALLGIEMPAVKDLAGLANALMENEFPEEYSDNLIYLNNVEEKETVMPAKDDKPDTPVGMFTQDQVDTLVSSAVDKALDKSKAEFEAQTKDIKKELEVATKRAEGAEKQIADLKVESAKKEAESLVNDAIKNGKLLPKQKDFAMAALLATDTKVKFGDEEKSMPDVFKEFLEAQGKVVDLDEHGSGKNKKVEFSNAAEEVDYLVKQAMANHKGDGPASYEKYFDTVIEAEENADLKQRYFEASN